MDRSVWAIRFAFTNEVDITLLRSVARSIFEMDMGQLVQYAMVVEPLRWFLVQKATIGVTTMPSAYMVLT